MEQKLLLIRQTCFFNHKNRTTISTKKSAWNYISNILPEKDKAHDPSDPSHMTTSSALAPCQARVVDAGPSFREHHRARILVQVMIYRRLRSRYPSRPIRSLRYIAICTRIYGPGRVLINYSLRFASVDFKLQSWLLSIFQSFFLTSSEEIVT